MKRLRIANGRLERDLLRGDRGDERLERVGLQRRPEARERRDESARASRPRRPGVEAVEIERQAEEAKRLPLDRGVVRLDVDSARRRLDPHLAAGEDAVQAVVAPEVARSTP